MRDRDADVAAALALHADAVARDPRLAALELGGEHLEQLVLVDRAAAQLEVDLHVRGDRGRARQGRDVLRVGVDDRAELGDVGEVAQRLDAAGGGAGADRDHPARHLADLLDPLELVGGGDRALDQRHVVRALHHRPGGLGEVGDLDRAGEWDQLVLAVEQGQLAAVARRELPDRELRAAPGRCGRGHSSALDIRGARTSYGENRAVDAEEELAQLAVAAQPDAALHVALHGQPHAGRRGTPRSREGRGGCAASSPRGRRPGPGCGRRRTSARSTSRVTSPTSPSPGVPSAVDGDLRRRCRGRSAQPRRSSAKRRSSGVRAPYSRPTRP